MKLVTDYDKKRAIASESISDLVGSTLGPYGHNVDFHSDSQQPLMYRDGFKVLEKYKPSDGLTNAVKMRIQEAAYKTMSNAGDGTTTTTILIATLYNAIFNSGLLSTSRRYVAKAIRAFGSMMVDAIRLRTIHVDPSDEKGMDMLRNAATIAGGNDKAVGEAISTLVAEIGVDGQLMVEVDPNISEIVSEVKPGYSLKSGLIATSLLPKGMAQIRLKDAWIALIKTPLNTRADLRAIISAWNAACQKQEALLPMVLFTGPVAGDARADLLHRRDKDGNVLPWYVVHVNTLDPGAWDDLSAVTGAQAVSNADGRGVKHLKADNGAVVDNIVLSMVETTINTNPDILKESGLIERIKDSIEGLPEDQKKAGEERIARLEGRVGIIKVPAGTSARMAWLAEVMEDAYKATVAALKYGVVPGAGITFIRAAADIQASDPLISMLAKNMNCITSRLLRNGGVGQSEIDAAIKTLMGGDRTTLLLSDENLDHLIHGQSGMCIYESTFIGVLDASQALTDAISAATMEVADWVETSSGVVPDSFINEDEA